MADSEDNRGEFVLLKVLGNYCQTEENFILRLNGSPEIKCDTKIEDGGKSINNFRYILN